MQKRLLSYCGEVAFVYARVLYINHCFNVFLKKYLYIHKKYAMISCDGAVS